MNIFKVFKEKRLLIKEIRGLNTEIIKLETWKSNYYEILEKYNKLLEKELVEKSTLINALNENKQLKTKNKELTAANKRLK